MGGDRSLGTLVSAKPESTLGSQAASNWSSVAFATGFGGFVGFDDGVGAGVSVADVAGVGVSVGLALWSGEFDGVGLFGVKSLPDEDELLAT